jgi:hypothetical protein
MDWYCVLVYNSIHLGDGEMKVTELSLNNWVNFSFADTTADVKICFNDLSHFEMNIKMCRFDDIYKPIKLTKEWLIKLGFKADGIWYVKSGVSVNLEDYRVVVEDNTGDGIFYNQIARVYNVHTLQNLFHILTGEEL